MAEEVLLPGVVTVEESDGSPAFWPESFIVGSPPQWADATDATYSSSATGLVVGPAIHNDIARAPLDTMSMDPGQVYDMVLRVRADGDPHAPSANELGLSVLIGTPAVYGDLFGIWALTGGDPIVDLEMSTRALAAMFAVDPDALVAAYAAVLAVPGQTVWVSIAGTYDVAGPVVGRVYELSVTVIGLGGGSARPVRMFPRHDGRNTSSAPRVVGGIE